MNKEVTTEAVSRKVETDDDDVGVLLILEETSQDPTMEMTTDDNIEYFEEGDGDNVSDGMYALIAVPPTGLIIGLVIFYLKKREQRNLQGSNQPAKEEEKKNQRQ